MKAVMLSIQPKWCELIARGEKTLEVRKTRPKLETPFKCYIYCTKEKPGRKHQYEGFGINGKPVQCGGYIVAEFVCDEIRDARECFIAPTCLTTEEWLAYTNGYKKPVWCWHISDLKIYDRPKELSDFKQCHKCELHEGCKQHEYSCDGRFKLIRPPQSWCYVED